MGIVALEAILGGAQPNGDDAVAIGALPMRSLISAMRVQSDGTRFVYAGEIPIHVAMTWRMIEGAGGDRHRWWRLEVKADTALSEARSRDELVVALHPYASGWLQAVPFKPPSKKGATHRADMSVRTFASTTEAMRAIEALRYDYWEKGAYRTAAISEPDLPFGGIDELRNVQRQASFVFGICESAGACEDSLWGAEEVRRLLEATRNDTIRFWSTDARIRGRPRLFEEVKAEADLLMLLAIRQALAGPHKDADRWIGRPVVDKVDQIYRGHLNRRNRQVGREEMRLLPFDEADPGEFDDLPDEEDAFSAFGASHPRSRFAG